MNSSAYSFRLFLVGWMSLAVPLVVGADQPTEADQIRKGRPADWKAALKKNADERQALAAALMEVALDKKVKNDDRNEAVVLLGEIPSKEVFEFLLNHLILKIPKDFAAGWHALSPRRAWMGRALKRAGFLTFSWDEDEVHSSLTLSPRPSRIQGVPPCHPCHPCHPVRYRHQGQRGWLTPTSLATFFHCFIGIRDRTDWWNPVKKI